MGWEHIPSDLLWGVYELLNGAYSNADPQAQVLLAVCKGWNRVLKQHITCLSPAYLPTDTPQPSSAHEQARAWNAQELVLEAVRHKYTKHTVLTAPWTPGKHQLSIVPCLTSLTLKGQNISCSHGTSFMRALPDQAKSLTSLDLTMSVILPDVLTDTLPALSKLVRLSLAGIDCESGVHTRDVQAARPPARQLVVRELANQSLLLRVATPVFDKWAAAAGRAALARAVLAAVATLPALRALNLDVTAGVDCMMAPITSGPWVPAHTADARACALMGLAATDHCSALRPLTTLTTLSLAFQDLTSIDWQNLGSMTQLQVLTTGVGRPRGARPHQPVMPEFVNLGCLTRLQRLELDVRYSDSDQLYLHGSLGQLTALTSLSVTSCGSLPLALSITHLKKLVSLQLSWLHSALRHPELIVHLASELPHLTDLDVSYAPFLAHVSAPGDIIVRGLAAVRPALRSLRMARMLISGGGFRPQDATQPGPVLPCLETLVVSAKSLLSCNYAHIALLKTLKHFELGDMSSKQLTAASTSGALQALSSLTALTHLEILSCEDSRRDLQPKHLRAHVPETIRWSTFVAPPTARPVPRRTPFADTFHDISHSSVDQPRGPFAARNNPGPPTHLCPLSSANLSPLKRAMTGQSSAELTDTNLSRQQSTMSGQLSGQLLAPGQTGGGRQAWPAPPPVPIPGQPQEAGGGAAGTSAGHGAWHSGMGGSLTTTGMHGSNTWQQQAHAGPSHAPHQAAHASHQQPTIQPPMHPPVPPPHQPPVILPPPVPPPPQQAAAAAAQAAVGAPQALGPNGNLNLGPPDMGMDWQVLDIDEIMDGMNESESGSDLSDGEGEDGMHGVWGEGGQGEGDGGAEQGGAGQGPGGMLTGQEAIIAALKATNSRLKDSALAFLGSLSQLKVLVIQSLHTTGSCLNHLTLSFPALQRLELDGELMLRWGAIHALDKMSFPRVESLSIHGLQWPTRQTPPTSTCTQQQPSHSLGERNSSGAGPSTSAAAAAAATASAAGAAGPRYWPCGPSTPTAGAVTADSAAAAAAARAAEAMRTSEGGSVHELPGSQQAQPTINDLLHAVVRAMPALQYLSVGACVGLQSRTVAYLARALRQLRYLCLYDAPQWAWARSGLQLSQLLCVDAGLPPANLRYVYVWSDTRDSGTYGAGSQGGCTLVRYGDALLPLE